MNHETEEKLQAIHDAVMLLNSEYFLSADEGGRILHEASQKYEVEE